MRQVQVGRERQAAVARRRTQDEQMLRLDPRDADIVRAKSLIRAETVAADAAWPPSAAELAAAGVVMIEDLSEFDDLVPHLRPAAQPDPLDDL